MNGGILVIGTKAMNKQDFVRCLKTRSPNLIQKEGKTMEMDKQSGREEGLN